MSIKGNWRRHGSEVVIRWCQRFFFLAASRLSFAASPLNSVAPNEKKTSGTQGSVVWMLFYMPLRDCKILSYSY